jgi:hypothetical protein
MALTTKLIELAHETRTRAAAGEGITALSPRSLMSFADSVVGSVRDADGMTWQQLAEITLINRQESAMYATLKEMIKAKFGTGVPKL